MKIVVVALIWEVDYKVPPGQVEVNLPLRLKRFCSFPFVLKLQRWWLNLFFSMTNAPFVFASLFHGLSSMSISKWHSCVCLMIIQYTFNFKLDFLASKCCLSVITFRPGFSINFQFCCNRLSQWHTWDIKVLKLSIVCARVSLMTRERERERLLATQITISCGILETFVASYDCKSTQSLSVRVHLTVTTLSTVCCLSLWNECTHTQLCIVCSMLVFYRLIAEDCNGFITLLTCLLLCGCLFTD